MIDLGESGEDAGEDVSIGGGAIGGGAIGGIAAGGAVGGAGGAIIV